MHYAVTTHPTYKINSAYRGHPAQSDSSHFPTFLVKYDTVSIDQNSVLMEQGFWRMQTALYFCPPPLLAPAHFISINFTLKA